MAARAAGDFQVTGWDESTYRELAGQSKLTRAGIKQTYTAQDLELQAEWDMLMAYRDDGTATYSGQGWLEGTVAGRAGGFVAQTQGGYDGSEAESTWSVVTGTGTGALKGLRGQGTARAPHGTTGTFEFEYEL